MSWGGSLLSATVLCFYSRRPLCIIIDRRKRMQPEERRRNSRKPGEGAGEEQEEDEREKKTAVEATAIAAAAADDHDDDRRRDSGEEERPGGGGAGAGASWPRDTTETGRLGEEGETGRQGDGETLTVSVSMADTPDVACGEKISLHSFRQRHHHGDDDDDDDSGDEDDTKSAATHKERTWRQQLAQWMSTNRMQYIILALVVLDSLIVIFELLIDLEIIVIPEDHGLEAANASTPTFPTNLTGSITAITITTTLTPHRRRRHGHTTRHHNATGSGESREHSGDSHAPNKHLAEEVLHFASLLILSIFMVEVILKVIAEGKHLLKKKSEVFDAVVVVVSFTMDIGFTIVPVSEAAQGYAGFLVLLRLWRFTRIINGVILSVKMDADKKLKAQKKLRAKAERKVQRLTNKVDLLTQENQMLRVRLTTLETIRDGSSTDVREIVDMDIHSNRRKCSPLTPLVLSTQREVPASSSTQATPRLESDTTTTTATTAAATSRRRSRPSPPSFPPFSSSLSLTLPHDGRTMGRWEVGEAERASSMSPLNPSPSAPAPTTPVPGEQLSVFGQRTRSSLCSRPESQQLLPFEDPKSGSSVDVRDSSMAVVTEQTTLETVAVWRVS